MDEGEGGEIGVYMWEHKGAIARITSCIKLIDRVPDTAPSSGISSRLARSSSCSPNPPSIFHNFTRLPCVG
jgi:hypothetical protein